MSVTEIRIEKSNEQRKKEYPNNGSHNISSIQDLLGVSYKLFLHISEFNIDVYLHAFILKQYFLEKIPHSIIALPGQS